MNVYTMPGVSDMSMVWMGAGGGAGVGGGAGGPGGASVGVNTADHLLGYPHHQDGACDSLMLDHHDSPYYTASSHHSAASNQSLDDMSNIHHSPLAPLEGLDMLDATHHLTAPDSNADSDADDGDDSCGGGYDDGGQLQPHTTDTGTQTPPCPASVTRKIKPVRHPGLVLKTPIAYQSDTDPSVIPIQKDGIAVCQKCGAIGVKHAFYTRERRFCSMACARGYPGLLAGDHLAPNSTGNSASQSPPSGGKNLSATYAEHAFKMEFDEDYKGFITDDPVLPQLPSPPAAPTPPPPMASILEDLAPPTPLVRRKHTTGQLANSWDWDPDLNRRGADFYAAPVLCFRTAPMRDVWPDIQVGMKVEVENTDCEGGGRELSVVDSFWVATVIRIVGYKALLRYEGFGQNTTKDFWVSLCSNQVHPVGWCATRGKPLIPPKTIENKYSDWKDFLRKRLTGARTLPSNYGLKVADNLRSRFRCGLHLEVVDKMRISQVKVAVVHKIVGKRLNVKYYDLPPDDAGFWCHEDSALLHPCGWAKKVGHNLVAPATYHHHHQRMPTPFHPHHHPNNASTHISDPSTYATDDLFTAIQVGTCTETGGASAQQQPHPAFVIGMKLEAIDPLNLSAICAATVMAVLRRGYIMIRIDMYEADLTGADWFCYHSTSPCIFPVGFCATHRIPLTPPKGYIAHTFTWSGYLAETGHVPVPLAAFVQPAAQHAFREGMKIEAADLMDPRLVCVGTIARVVGRLLKVHFDGWEDEYDQWLDCDSPDIYPVGWCFSVGHKLEGPRVIQKITAKQHLTPKGLKKRRKKKSPNKNTAKELNKTVVHISKSVGSDDVVDIMDIDDLLEAKADPDYDAEMEFEPELPQSQAISPNPALYDNMPLDSAVTMTVDSGVTVKDSPDTMTASAGSPITMAVSPLTLAQSPVALSPTLTCGSTSPVNVMTVTSTSSGVTAAPLDTVCTAATTPVLATTPPPPPERKVMSYVNVTQSTSPKVIPRIIDNAGALTKQVAPDEWNVFDVAQFLRVNDCANYCDCFSKQKVDGTRLLNLNKEDILDYTGGKVGPSLKIYDLVQQLKIKMNPSQSRHMKANIKKFL